MGLAVSTVSAWCIAAPLSLLVTTERARAAADCADSTTLLRKIEQIAQRPLAPLAPLAPDADAIRVVIRFDRNQGEYRADLEFQGPKPGERSLLDRSDRCEPLEDAVAVAIALLLDREIERRKKELTELPSAAPTIKIIRGQVEPMKLQRATLYAALESGGQAGFGSAAVPSFALAFGALPFAGWRLEASAWATLPMAHAYASGSVTLSLVAGALRACRMWGNEWQAGPCVAAAVGNLRGSGRGFDESLSSSLLWSAVGGSVLLQRSLGNRWELGLHALAWVPLREQHFGVQNLGVAWRSTAISPGLSVRLGFRFR